MLGLSFKALAIKGKKKKKTTSPEKKENNTYMRCTFHCFYSLEQVVLGLYLGSLTFITSPS